jgi:DNA-binding response OmpR family regulator
MEPSAMAAARNGTLRILIADDDRDIAESFAVLLELDGHECVVASDGEVAFRLFEQMEPDVVLLDIAMPRSSGHDVARRIRSLARERPVLLIAVTGWARESDKARSFAAGFDHHFSKPVDYAELAALLRVTARAGVSRAARSLASGTKVAAGQSIADWVTNTS